MWQSRETPSSLPKELQLSIDTSIEPSRQATSCRPGQWFPPTPNAISLALVVGWMVAAPIITYSTMTKDPERGMCGLVWVCVFRPVVYSIQIPCDIPWYWLVRMDPYCEGWYAGKTASVYLITCTNLYLGSFMPFWKKNASKQGFCGIWLLLTCIFATLFAYIEAQWITRRGMRVAYYYKWLV